MSAARRRFATFSLAAAQGQGSMGLLEVGLVMGLIGLIMRVAGDTDWTCKVNCQLINQVACKLSALRISTSIRCYSEATLLCSGRGGCSLYSGQPLDQKNPYSRAFGVQKPSNHRVVEP